MGVIKRVLLAELILLGDRRLAPELNISNPCAANDVWDIL